MYQFNPDVYARGSRVDSEPGSGQFCVTELRQQNVATLIIYISAGGSISNIPRTPLLHHRVTPNLC